MKRLFDIVASAAGLIVLSPLLLLIGCGIWLEDRNSPLFLGRRVARFGGEFRMVKFRTMIPNAWKSGVSSTAAGDRRITRIGAVLRRFKLDELPQLWNVLIGEMSFVGPRPQVETDASMYTEVERRMLDVRPGITDLASIVFADEGEILTGSADPDLRYNQVIRPWKSRIALLAIDHSTVVGDVATILLTFYSAVSRQGALDAVSRRLAVWGAEAKLVEIARRTRPLEAWPPPGANEIVTAYPGAQPSPQTGPQTGPQPSLAAGKASASIASLAGQVGEHADKPSIANEATTAIAGQSGAARNF